MYGPSWDVNPGLYPASDVTIWGADPVKLIFLAVP